MAAQNVEASAPASSLPTRRSRLANPESELDRSEESQPGSDQLESGSEISSVKIVTTMIESKLLVVEVPSIALTTEYCQNKLFTKLSGTQANILGSIRKGLAAQGATLQNGRIVETPVDAIRWMLENFKNQIAA